ncbi:MAG: phospho-N-acetylmuramoyl-pentapeptide-transferase, partial [Planktothrix sp.]
MDSKFSSVKSFNLSGQTLLLFLTLGLSVFALSLDGVNDHLFHVQGSLFLPWLLCTVAVSALGSWVIPILVRIKAGQFIREDGPQAHLQKAGTPTMGGIFFVPVGVAISLILTQFHLNVIAVSTLTLAYGFIGWLDDWQILRRQSNKGISPR